MFQLPLLFQAWKAREHVEKDEVSLHVEDWLNNPLSCSGEERRGLATEATPKWTLQMKSIKTTPKMTL